MGLADFRYNPFSNAMELINITDEVHAVPVNSPYQIRLSEVPSKDNPSSVVVKYLDSGDLLTEVGAPPSEGQFWCDYNTENSSWNTGLLRFNAGDAGKVVKVSYKGSGTLAGAKSGRNISIWTARGNGELGSKVCTNGEVLSGIYQFTNFVVPTDVTVYIENFACILCTGSFVNSGTISGEGRGAQQNTLGLYGGSGGKGGSTTFDEYGGPNNGAASSYNEQLFTYTGSPPAVALNVLTYLDNALMYGAGGGNSDRASGGRGGAGIRVVAASIINKGTINLNGGRGASGFYISPGKYCGGGGGGGGGVGIFIANDISNTGAISVDAGAGGSYGGDRSGNGYAGSPGAYKLIVL